MTDRPPPPKSGRAPRQGAEIYDPLSPLSRHTVAALELAVFVQNRKGDAAGKKSHRLSRIASELELAFIEKRPKKATETLCLDVAALALRILEQGD